MTTLRTLPEYTPLPQWCEISGMTRTATYHALGRGELRAKKCGRRTLIHVPTGLEYIESLPDAEINVGTPKCAV